MGKRKKSILFFILLAFFAVNFAGGIIDQNERIAVAEFDLYSDKVTHPVTIVQISDLHEKSFGRGNARLFEQVRTLHPDLIAITGDIIFNSYTQSPDIAYMENLAAQCAATAPSFFVTGNHDRYHEQAVKEAFSSRGVTVLDETVVPFTAGDTQLMIGGIDDPSLDKDSIDRIHFPDNGHFNILLAHDPEPFAETYDRKNADLVLSGHTHGGQVRLPWGKAVFTPEGFLPEYSDGLYTSGDTTMVISMGLGSSVIPIRLFAQPEITLIRLLPSPPG